MASAGSFRYRKVSRDDLEAMRSLPTRQVFRSLGLPWWRLPRLARHIRGRAEASAGRIRLFSSVPRLLRTLHEAGMTLAVVSSNGEPVVRSVLGAELSALFSQFECEGSIFGKARKFRRIVRQSRVPATEVAVIGGETRDLDAARKAGLKGFAVEWGFADPVLLRDAAPGRTVADVAKLERVLLGDGASRTGPK